MTTEVVKAPRSGYEIRTDKVVSVQKLCPDCPIGRDKKCQGFTGKLLTVKTTPLNMNLTSDQIEEIKTTAPCLTI